MDSADRRESGQLIAVLDGTGATLREYIYWGNQQIALISNGTTYYIHNDHLNTPQVITNQNQQVVWMGDYEPFGKVASNLNNNTEIFSRFPGQYLDSETGLYYNYFRDYDPSIGRYIESDPIGLGGGINTYAYVEANPIKKFDLFGLVSLCVGTIRTYEHAWVCSGNKNCAGLMPAGSVWQAATVGPGVVQEENYNENVCRDVDLPEQCKNQAEYERCVEQRVTNLGAQHAYGLAVYNCRDWAEDTINYCGLLACSKQ